MSGPQHTSNRLEALLAAACPLLLSMLLLGSTFLYGLHAVVFFLACRLLMVSPEWRVRTVDFFRAEKGIWIAMAAFSFAFSLPFSFSGHASIADWSELKWVLVFAALLMPAGALLRSRGAGKFFRWSSFFLLALIVVSAIDGVVQFVGGWNPLREWFGREVDDFGRRATGLLRNPIPFGHAMGGFFWVSASGVLVAWVTGSKRLALMAGVICATCFSGVLLSLTRGAWVAVALVSVISLPFLKGEVRKLWLVCLGIACAFGLTVVAVDADTRARLVSGFNPDDTTNRMRLELWQANFEILKDHPFGVGYNANDHLIEEKFDELGFAKHEWMGHSHNEFIEIAVGSGWLGVGLYLWISGWFLIAAISGVRCVTFESAPWVAFLFSSSALVQVFVHTCALTDQMSTAGRFLLCLAWAIALAARINFGRLVHRDPHRTASS